MEYVKVHLTGEILEGILVKEDEKHLTLKLDSGYNIGVSKNTISRLEKISEVEHQNGSKHQVKQDSNLPRILILHTGGTIASKVDYKTGAVTARFEPSELMAMFPELRNL